jgi:CcmD family protein
MVYLFAAYLILWSITFGYLFTLGRRQRQLEQQLASLQGGQTATGQPARDRALRGESQPEV